MNTPHSSRFSLRSALIALQGSPDPAHVPGAIGASWNGFSSRGPVSIPVAELLHCSVLGERSGALHNRSVLLSTADPLAAALALVELDGLARRIVLRPPGVPAEYLPELLQTAEVDTVVSDAEAIDGALLPVEHLHIDSARRTPLTPPPSVREADRATEWVLLTSGTTGPPKLVVHSLTSLAGALQTGVAAKSDGVWSTFYDIRRYGGLQIYLRALLSGASLVLPGAGEPTAAFLQRAAAARVTHISGTPSHWRQAMLHPEARLLKPAYVRLSGEIADQPVLDRLQSLYPAAQIVHAFASTEAGLVFEVTDGLAGVPAGAIIAAGGNEQEEASSAPRLKLESGTVRVRSSRAAERYLGATAPRLKDDDGFVDTHDVLELRGDRYYFAGRLDGVINVGGWKVHPEEVEAVLNRCPGVRMSLVRSKKSAITGAVVVADVVLESGGGSPQPEGELLRYCRQFLPAHKVPASIRVVSSLDLAHSGKLGRGHA